MFSKTNYKGAKQKIEETLPNLTHVPLEILRNDHCLPCKNTGHRINCTAISTVVKLYMCLVQWILDMQLLIFSGQVTIFEAEY